MRRALSIRLFLVLSCITFQSVFSQTLTAPDPDVPGGSIIEVVTVDIDGLPTTQIVQSIPPIGAVPNPATGTTASITNPLAPTLPTSTSTSATKTPTPVAAPVGPGPVAQPPPTVPVGQGVTEYTYTTVDDLGQTTVLQDIFTPTYNTPSPPASPAVGTVLGLSAWTALIGTNTRGAPSSHAETWRISRTGVGAVVVIACGVAGGALTIL